jgi:hypothetical protein
VKWSEKEKRLHLRKLVKVGGIEMIFPLLVVMHVCVTHMLLEVSKKRKKEKKERDRKKKKKKRTKPSLLHYANFQLPSISSKTKK